MALLIKEKAAIDADEVRDAYWDRRYPVNPEMIARRMGMAVSRRLLSQGTSGILQVEPELTPMIYVDFNDVEQRQTFTIAHEIGHYYERTSSGAVDFNFIDRRGGKYDAHEFYADEFAANLLMPEGDVAREFSRGTGLAGMASKYGVSLPAMKLRLRRLGLRIS